MGTIECSQPASKSSWDSQDFGDISMVLKWPIFASPSGHDELIKVLYTYGSNLAILSWMGDELSRGLTWRRTDGPTHAGNDNTRRPKLASV